MFPVLTGYKHTLLFDRDGLRQKGRKHMSVEKITSKILDDARQRAEDILARAEDERQKILAHARKDAANIKEQMLSIAGKNAESNIKKTQSLADLEGKKEVLKAKQACIEKVYHLALEQIRGMEDNAYLKLLEKLVKKANPERDARIQFNERDKQRFGGETTALGLEVSDSAGNFTAGFILQMGDTSVNCTFDEILKSALEDHKKEVADILFGT